MAPLTFALLAILAASLASAGPVALDDATLLLNGVQALVLNCQFQNLQQSDPCNTGETACIQGETATCVGGTWQTLPCPSSKSCFALPSIRTNGTFIACTSPNNAASIIAATGVQQTDISNNCTSLGNTPFPFSTPNNTGNGGQSTTQGGNVSGDPNCAGSSTSYLPGQGLSPTPITTTQPTLTLPPTTTTLSPEQASPLISFLSANGLSSPSSVPSPGPGNVINLGGSGNTSGTSGTPPIIILTPNPVSSPSPTSTPTSSSVANSSNGGY